jgi:hypothetical protein
LTGNRFRCSIARQAEQVVKRLGHRDYSCTVGASCSFGHSLEGERILRHPNCAVRSDRGIREFGVGVPHPRSYGTNARVLAECEGYAADPALFDPARVQDQATFLKPHQYSEGFDLILVNGQPVVDNGKLTGTRSPLNSPDCAETGSTEPSAPAVRYCPSPPAASMHPGCSHRLTA